MNLLIPVALLLSSPSWGKTLGLDALSADYPTCGLLHEIDFIPALKAIRQTTLPVRLLAASPVVIFPSRDGAEAHCSSSAVSDAGTLLSAGHCLEDCMIANQAVSQFEEGGEPLTRHYDLTQRKDPSPIFCSARINGVNTKVEVVAASFCRVLDEQTPGLSAEAKAACLAQPDFAILRPLPIVKGKKSPALPCFRLGNSEEAEGRKVMVLGFPRDTHRKKTDPDALDSNGKGQFISFGRAGRRSDCQIDVKQESHDLKDLEASSDFLQLDNDAVAGNSGGPVLLQDSGRVVAVVARSASNENFYCRGSVFGTSITQIRRALAPKFDAQGFAALFSCEKNAAVPESDL